MTRPKKIPGDKRRKKPFAVPPPVALPTEAEGLVHPERWERAKKRRGGPPVPRDWKRHYLEHLEQYGTYKKAARAAGISESTAVRERQHNPAFADACSEAYELAADGYEEALTEQARETGNPVGYIVRLKAMRPKQYIEKHAIMSLTMTADLSDMGANEQQAALSLFQSLAGLADTFQRPEALPPSPAVAALAQASDA